MLKVILFQNKERKTMSNNLSSHFIETFRNKKEEVTIFLTNGVKLQGVIVEVSTDSLTLKRDGITQLVFRQAIATILPKTEY